MADKSGQTFALPKQSSIVAEMFTTQEQRDDAKREKVVNIPLAEIDAFPDHPFQVKLDEAMTAMAESVKAVGIQSPAIVHQKEDGRYELVSGHRRKMACELAGLEAMPCIVRELSRDEAIIAMVDANLQREVILPSEKAKSYKMRLDAMKRQAGRPSQDNYSPVGNNLSAKTSSAELAEAIGESKNQIFRYIRLTELIPEVLDLVDEGKIAMRPAVELSYLPTEAQEILLETIDSEDCTPNHAQAIKMRKFADEGRLTEDVMLSIMQEEKPNQVEQFKMPRERINKYFAPGTLSSTR
ncbi:MAG: ParB/RepB/Spo0J family partition protein [Clostridiales bacterium]|jgi:ParB family chromosome partitioning protein|nr:ParB/RepB/Spo0J family partition protein [Clostridiales bacterium]